MKARLIERLKYSRLSRLAALPLRLHVSLRPLALQAARTLRWLLQSREWTNFNGDYEPEGLEAVVCALAELSGRSRAELRAFAQEIHGDDGFAQRYHQRVRETRLRHSASNRLVTVPAPVVMVCFQWPAARPDSRPLTGANDRVVTL